MVPVLSISPFRVGVVRWRDEDGRKATVVVKGTFTFDEERRASIAMRQAELRDDVAHPEGGDGELIFASDFAPYKRQPEFFANGYAYATTPASEVEVVFEVGSRRRAVTATLGVDELTVPLVRRRLRDGATSSSVGPRSDYSTPSEVDAAELKRPSRFNAAPAEQQLDTLKEDAPIRIWGMRRDGGVWSSRLPGLRPTIFLARSEPDAVPTLVALTCDTLIIDAASHSCSLVWRGQVSASALDGATLVSAVSLAQGAIAWEDIEWQLRHAAREVASERTLALRGAEEPQEEGRRSERTQGGPGSDAASSFDTTATMSPPSISAPVLPFREPLLGDRDRMAAEQLAPRTPLAPQETVELPAPFVNATVPATRPV